MCSPSPVEINRRTFVEHEYADDRWRCAASMLTKNDFRTEPRDTTATLKTPFDAITWLSINYEGVVGWKRHVPMNGAAGAAWDM